MIEILISQPMKGLTQEQIKLNRDSIVKRCEDLGWRVIDSVFDFEDISGVLNKPLFYLSKSLELIASKADAVLFMKGWQFARGCKLEHECCKEYDVPILYEEEE